MIIDVINIKEESKGILSSPAPGAGATQACVRQRRRAAMIGRGVRGPTRPTTFRAAVATATASRATGPAKAAAGKATAVHLDGGQTVAINVEVEKTETEIVAVCRADPAFACHFPRRLLPLCTVNCTPFWLPFWTVCSLASP